MSQLRDLIAVWSHTHSTNFSPSSVCLTTRCVAVIASLFVSGVLRTVPLSHTHTHTHIRTHAHTHTHTHIRTHTHARTHALTHARTHARTHAHTHTHTRTHARTHTHTHARTHTHTHTHYALFPPPADQTVPYSRGQRTSVWV